MVCSEGGGNVLCVVWSCSLVLLLPWVVYFSTTLETTVLLNRASVIVKVTLSFITPSVHSFIIRSVIIHISMETWLPVWLCHDLTTGNDFKCHSDCSRNERHCPVLITSLPVCTFSNNVKRAHFTTFVSSLHQSV